MIPLTNTIDASDVNRPAKELCQEGIWLSGSRSWTAPNERSDLWKIRLNSRKAKA